MSEFLLGLLQMALTMSVLAVFISFTSILTIYFTLNIVDRLKIRFIKKAIKESEASSEEIDKL